MVDGVRFLVMWYTTSYYLPSSISYCIETFDLFNVYNTWSREHQRLEHSMCLYIFVPHDNPRIWSCHVAPLACCWSAGNRRS